MPYSPGRRVYKPYSTGSRANSLGPKTNTVVFIPMNIIMRKTNNNLSFLYFSHPALRHGFISEICRQFLICAEIARTKDNTFHMPTEWILGNLCTIDASENSEPQLSCLCTKHRLDNIRTYYYKVLFSISNRKRATERTSLFIDDTKTLICLSVKRTYIEP